MSISQFRSNNFQVTSDSLCIFGLMVKAFPDMVKMGYCDGCGATNDCNMEELDEEKLIQKCLKLAPVLETHRNSGSIERVKTIAMSHLMLAYLYAGNELTLESFKGSFESRIDLPKHKELMVVSLPSVNFVNFGLKVRVIVVNSSDGKFGECSFLFLDRDNKLVA